MMTSEIARFVTPVESVWGAIACDIEKLKACATPRYDQVNVAGPHVDGEGRDSNVNLDTGPGALVSGKTPDVDVEVIV